MSKRPGEPDGAPAKFLKVEAEANGVKPDVSQGHHCAKGIGICYECPLFVDVGRVRSRWRDPCMWGRISEGRVRGCIGSCSDRGHSGSDMLSPAGPSTTGDKGSKDRCVRTKIQIVMGIPRSWINGLAVQCLGLMLVV